MKRFYRIGFHFDDDQDSVIHDASHTVNRSWNRPKQKRENHDKPLVNDARECIAACLVGSFLLLSIPATLSLNSSDEKLGHDKNAMLLIFDPQWHPQMFYIMTMGTAHEFWQTGLGSMLDECVVELIKSKPECGALYWLKIVLSPSMSGIFRASDRVKTQTL